MAASKPVVFVMVTPGNIGSATVSALAAKYADKVEIRAGVRNPDKAPESIKAPGVTIVQAVMGEKEKLKEIFKGVDALFIVTPGVKERASLTTLTAEAAKEAGVKFLMVISGRPSPNTFLGKQLQEVEDNVIKVGVPHCFICLPFFMENNWGNRETIVGQSAFYASLSPDTPNIYVVVEDAGKATAAILADYTKHEGKSYDITSNCFTNAELAAAFTEALGKEVKYVQVSLDAIKQGMMSKGVPEWQAEALLEQLKSIEDRGGLKGDLSVFESLTGEKPMSMKAWVTKNAAGFK